MKKKSILTSAILILLFCSFYGGYVWGQNNSVGIYYDWKDSSQSYKLGFVKGVYFGIVGTLGEACGTSRILSSYESLNNYLILNGKKIVAKPFYPDQAIDGINSYYNDFSNRDVGYSYICYLSINKIFNLMTDSEINTRLETARQIKW